MRKKLYMLVGPKGSGKTYIGNLIGKNTDIEWIRVENIWLSLKPGENGWEKVIENIDTAFLEKDKVMVESLGAGTEFQEYRGKLAKKYNIKMIRVYAEPKLCLQRVKNRTKEDHISVSEEKVEEYNRLAGKVAYKWDLEIENSIEGKDIEIIESIMNL